MRYQWQRNGVDLVGSATGDFLGAASATLTVENAHNSYEGDFRCLVWDVSDPATVLISNAASLSVLEGRAPFGGSPQTIPGTLEPERYDEGEPGDAYFDTTPDDLGVNDGNWHLRRDAVDFLTGANQVQIRWAYIAPGEFLKFTVDLTEPGPFDLAIRYEPGRSLESRGAEARVGRGDSWKPGGSPGA